MQHIEGSAAKLILGALAEECSSPTIPRITDDPGSFVANCNSLLTELGSTSRLTEKRNARPDLVSRESKIGFLLAKVPHAGVDEHAPSAQVPPHLQATEDPDLAYRKKVDEYLGRLRTGAMASANDRPVVYR